GSFGWMALALGTLTAAAKPAAQAQRLVATDLVVEGNRFEIVTLEPAAKTAFEAANAKLAPVRFKAAGGPHCVLDHVVVFIEVITAIVAVERNQRPRIGHIDVENYLTVTAAALQREIAQHDRDLGFGEAHLFQDLAAGTQVVVARLIDLCDLRLE